MIAAFIVGTIGFVISLWVGINFMKLDLTDVLLCILASNSAGLIALLSTLYAQKRFKCLQKLVRSSIGAWTFLSLQYFGILLLLSPPLRELSVFMAMFFPLILSTGFFIILFGPIQDFLVRQQQKKTAIDLKTLMTKGRTYLQTSLKR